MNLISNVKGRDIIKFVKSLGYEYVRKRGSHIRYKNKNGNSVTVNVERKKVIKPGRLHGLLKELGVTKKMFFEFMGFSNVKEIRNGN